MTSLNILQLFFKDTFDVELPLLKQQSFIDPDTKSLKVSTMLSDPLLKRNLIFRHLWKSITGVYPARVIATFYMNSDKFNPNCVDCDDVLKVLGVINPIYTFIKHDMDVMKNVMAEFSKQLEDVNDIKHHLCTKFAKRFGLYLHEVDWKNLNIFQIYKSCMFHKNGHARIKNICHGAMAKKNVKIPSSLYLIDDISSPQTYYSFTEDLVKYLHLTTTNIFTDYVNHSLNFGDEHVTLFDTIGLCCQMDGVFYKNLLGVVGLYIDTSPDSRINLQNLVSAADKHCQGGNKNLVLFYHTSHEDFLNDHTDKTTHIHKISIHDPYMMEFIPKLLSNFVVVSDKKDIIINPVCTNTVSSIFYFVGEWDNTPANTLISYTTIGDYNKFITHSSKHAEQLKMVLSRPVYIIPLKDDDDPLITDDFIQHQWTAHFQHPCPYTVWNTRAYSPVMNVLLYDNFLLKYIESCGGGAKLLQSFNNRDFHSAENAVVAIDNRPNIFTVISILVTFYNLNKEDWKLVLFCNNDNKSFYEKYFESNAVYVTDFYLPYKKFDIENYNDLLKNVSFWKTLEKNDVKKALFVQDDGMIISKGVEHDFLTYDYVGSPWNMEWKHENPNKFIHESINPDMVGNGGLSLRDVSKLALCCEKYADISKQLHYNRMQQQPEDVFFSFCCFKEKMSMPSYQEAQKFAVEQVWDGTNTPYGFHKMWVYRGVEEVEKIFNLFVIKQ